MSQNAAGGGELLGFCRWVLLYTGVQKNFGDLTLSNSIPYDLSYLAVFVFPKVLLYRPPAVSCTHNKLYDVQFCTIHSYRCRDDAIPVLPPPLWLHLPNSSVSDLDPYFFLVGGKNDAQKLKRVKKYFNFHQNPGSGSGTALTQNAGSESALKPTRIRNIALLHTKPMADNANWVFFFWRLFLFATSH